LAIGSAGMAWALRPRDRIAAFFAVGTAIATIPAFAAWPNDRLLPIPSFGAAALVARAVADPSTPRPAVALLVAAHLVRSPPLLPHRPNRMALTPGPKLPGAIQSVPADPA